MTPEVIYQPPFEIIAKPKYGNPCNGCGWCCHMSVCKIGQHFFKVKEHETPCPGMRFENNKVRCAVVVAEEFVGNKKEPSIAMALGIGKGCDADDLEVWENE